MAFQADTVEKEPVSALLIQTLISAFTFLSALSIRDTVMQGIQQIAPESASKKFMFTACISMFFLFCTVIMAYSWQDRI